MEGAVLLLVLIVISFAIYFFPAAVAQQRGHRNTLAIFMTNLFLGWTFLGWVAALIWACTDNKRE
jgi:uncharacterized membrane protein YqaE (UPF0057 family)